MELAQFEPYFVKFQNLLYNGHKMQHNTETVCVASYVSYIEHIAFLPMSHAY